VHVDEARWHQLQPVKEPRHLLAGPQSLRGAIQAITGLRSLPLSPWAGLGVLAAWAAAALLAGGLRLEWRDA